MISEVGARPKLNSWVALVRYILLGPFTRVVLPACLALANALFWYFPEANTIMGYGDDPSYNLWVHEHHWAVFSHSGPLAFLTRSFWESNIFYPEPLTIALSEDYVATALLSWPLKIATGNGPQALSLFCVLTSLAAFYFAAKWLQSLGVKHLAFWGGLAFAGCGWVQTQAAHFQNAAIFVFPLALWMWRRFTTKSTIGPLLLCAFSFGWIIGWNLYYQTFCNVILVVLVSLTAIRKRELRPKLTLLLVATVVFELPIASRYLKLQTLIGDYSVAMGEFHYYAARWTSLFFHSIHRSLLQAHFPSLYPTTANATLESAGFIGYVWLALWTRALAVGRSARPWAIAALGAFLVAMGPDYGVFNLLLKFPGMSSLRAIGRAQIVSTVFSLPAVFLLLEKDILAGGRRIWKTLVPMTLLLLELTPGRPRDFVRIPAQPWVSDTLVRKIQAQKSQSLLILPTANPNLQMYFVGVPIRLYSGYSGRYPIQHELIYRAAKAVHTPLEVESLLKFAKCSLVASTSPQWNSLLERVSDAIPLGCEWVGESHLCLFDASKAVRERWSQVPRIRLDRDTRWEYGLDNSHATASFRTTHAGVLDIEHLANCHIIEYVKYPLLPEFSNTTRIADWQLSIKAYPTETNIYTWTSSRSILSLPSWYRAKERVAIQCTNY